MEKVDYFGILGNPRKISKIKDEDKLYKKLTEQINNPNPLRSEILTLHLLIEYWLNKILEEMGYTKLDKMSFHQKNEELHNKNIIDDRTYQNTQVVNRIRNIYAHEIDLDKLDPKIIELLNKIEFSLDFETSSGDKLLAIAIQTMFQLEDKYYDIKYADEIKVLSDEEIKQKLLDEGKLFWQYCEILDKREGLGSETHYILKCPHCLKGEITRIHDDTPGFKESYFHPCQNCGLHGDGSMLDIATVKKKID